MLPNVYIKLLQCFNTTLIDKISASNTCRNNFDTEQYTYRREKKMLIENQSTFSYQLVYLTETQPTSM